MKDEALFSVLSKCFAPVDEDEWTHLASRALWSDFLDSVRAALQDDYDLGATTRPIARARQRCPLQDFLSVGEVNALFRPPTYEEKRSFAARHFTGGLPASAVPVESLYAKGLEGKRPGEARESGAYWGDSARYMRELTFKLGLSVPAEFAACPDHLALELDMMAVLLRSGMQAQARAFLVERFAWLTSYRIKLIGLAEDASFYVGLVDVLMGIRVRQTLDLSA